MKYIIIKACCKFADSTTKILRYSEDIVTEENSCNDINAFRKSLKDKLNKQFGVEVTNISLVYAERDGRQ